MSGDRGKVKMSDGLRDMKFMQRTPNAQLQSSQEISVERKKKRAHKKGVEFECSYVIVEDLRFGRFSYQGFNKEVEKIMLIHDPIDDPTLTENPDEVDVGFEEAAMQMSLAKNIAKKFDRKRKAEDGKDQRPKKNKKVKSEKFMKPGDD